MKKELNIQIHFFLTTLLAFLLPIYPWLIPLVIILLALNWLISGNISSFFKKPLWGFLFLISVALYIEYLIGLIYSDNLEYGLKDIETKLSILIFPMIYVSAEQLKEQQFQTVLKAFINGCVAYAIICFAYALYQYLGTLYAISHGIQIWNYGINLFLKDRFSIWIHPSYSSMYFVMALVIIYLQRDKNLPASIFRKYFIPLILSSCVLLFSSKAGIISLAALGVCAGWQTIFIEQKIKVAVVTALIPMSIFFSLYFFAPEFALRINGAIKTLSTNANNAENDQSTAIRIAIWHSASAVISENWLIGTGTGDVKDALRNQYNNEKILIALKENLNAHNQFLQTFATLGIIGFLTLCSTLCIPLFQSWKMGNYLFVSFFLILIANFCVESMLETQAGVVFYAFFNSLFLFSEKEKL